MASGLIEVLKIAHEEGSISLMHLSEEDSSGAFKIPTTTDLSRVIRVIQFLYDKYPEYKFRVSIPIEVIEFRKYE